MTAGPGADRREQARAAVVTVAARLLQERGPAAFTTRGVAEAAGVQAPTIYRLFGDKDGLLDAVAEHVLADYVTAKAAVVQEAAAAGSDPLADLRAGWDAHVGFAMAHPALSALLHEPGRRSPAGQAGLALLARRVHRIALSGHLRVAEARAVDLLHAAGTGVVLTQLAVPASDRDPALPDLAYEAVLGAILTPSAQAVDHGGAPGAAPSPGEPEGDEVVRTAAVTLRAAMPRQAVLTAAERSVMVEWLDRVIDMDRRERQSTLTGAAGPRVCPPITPRNSSFSASGDPAGTV